MNSIVPSDCGKKVTLINRDFRDGKYEYKAEVQMIITSPKGRLVIFSNPKQEIQDLQCEAIRSFVEAHKDE
jgi:hypothetical protein